MKTVAQTVIEADRFYTIAAHTGNVIQAVEASKDGGTVRLGKYDHKPEQEWSFVRVGEAWTPWAWVPKQVPCCRSGRRCPVPTSCGPSLR